MVLQNHNTIAARAINATSTTGASCSSLVYGMNQNQSSIIDILVALISVPILILCALQLEKNLHDMADNPQSSWIVFALGISMLIVSVIICGYITHRMGVCIWTGSVDQAGTFGCNRGAEVPNDIVRVQDMLPPSYDSVIKFDIPPPPYDGLIIAMEQDNKQEPDCNRNYCSRSGSSFSTTDNNSIV